MFSIFTHVMKPVRDTMGVFNKTIIPLTVSLGYLWPNGMYRPDRATHHCSVGSVSRQ